MNPLVRLWLVASVVALILAPFVSIGIGWALVEYRWMASLSAALIFGLALLWTAITVLVRYRVSDLPWYAAGTIVGCCIAPILAVPLFFAAMVMSAYHNPPM